MWAGLTIWPSSPCPSRPAPDQSMKAFRFIQKSRSCVRPPARGAARWAIAIGSLVAVSLLALTACASAAPTPLGPSATRPPALAGTTAGVSGVTPTVQPASSATLLTPAEPTSMSPSLTLTPAPPQAYLYVAVPTINPDNPLRFTFPTAAIFPTPLNWRPPLIGVPYALGPNDHFWFARPSPPTASTTRWAPIGMGATISAR